MKKFLMLLIAAGVVTSAQATLPEAFAGYVGPNGIVVYGMQEVYAVDKDTGNGNRVAVKYPGGTGTQYIVDDASWTIYNKITTSTWFLAKFVKVSGSSARWINVAATTGIYCQGGNSVIGYPNTNNAEVIADGCMFWSAARAAAN